MEAFGLVVEKKNVAEAAKCLIGISNLITPERPNIPMDRDAYSQSQKVRKLLKLASFD